jgi:hypothetical protein
VKLVVDKAALGQVFPPELGFSTVGINPSIIPVLLHQHVAFTGRTNGRSLGMSRKAMLSRQWESVA